LDSGNYSANSSPVGTLKSKALLKGMSMLGYSAANVGEREVRAGYASFIDLASDADFPFLSANIVRSDTGKPVFLPHLVLEVPRGDGGRAVRLGLIGVARFNPIFRKPGPDGTQLEIVHPHEAVERELAALENKKVDFVILLAALHLDDARRIVGAYPGIDFVIGSYGGIVREEFDEESESWILYSGNQGKQINETRIFLGEAEKRPEPLHFRHYLSDRYPTDPEMVEYVNNVSFKPAGLNGRGKAAAVSPLFVGSERCGQCHVPPLEQWSSTPHANALESLKEKNKQDEPDCLKCHTTGSGRKEGFKNLQTTPQLANVGCESCHGAGRSHILNPQRKYGAVNPAICTGCHDVDNSPDFDYYRYIAKVAHKEQASE
jgi:hypothetical protein